MYGDLHTNGWRGWQRWPIYSCLYRNRCSEFYAIYAAFSIHLLSSIHISTAMYQQHYSSPAHAMCAMYCERVVATFQSIYGKHSFPGNSITIAFAVESKEYTTFVEEEVKGDQACFVELYMGRKPEEFAGDEPGRNSHHKIIWFMSQHFAQHILTCSHQFNGTSESC